MKVNYTMSSFFTTVDSLIILLTRNSNLKDARCDQYSAYSNHTSSRNYKSNFAAELQAMQKHWRMKDMSIECYLVQTSQKQIHFIKAPKRTRPPYINSQIILNVIANWDHWRWVLLLSSPKHKLCQNDWSSDNKFYQSTFINFVPPIFTAVEMQRILEKKKC